MAEGKAYLLSKEESEDQVSMPAMSEERPEVPQQMPQQQEAEAAKELGLIGKWLQIYCVFTGQWFTPLAQYNILKASTTAKFCKIFFWLYQFVVCVLMWVYFAYAMGFLGVRTLTKLDWLCTITDIKNMLYSARWIVYQHLGVWYFTKGHLEQLLRGLQIKDEDCKQTRYVNFTTLFIGGATFCLIAFPLSLHTAQMIIPDFEPRPQLINGKVMKITGGPFPWWQIVFDGIAFLLQRLYTFPIIFVFLYVVHFHCREVQVFRNEIFQGNYKEHTSYLAAWIKYTGIMNRIGKSEKAFQHFLVFFITTLLLLSVLEIFSVIEKVETHMLYNYTMLLTPSTSMFAPAGSQASIGLSVAKAHVAFPARLTGKHAYPYFVVLVNIQTENATRMSTEGPLEKIITAVYKLSVLEIIISTVQDIAVNIVLYSFPLYQISKLQDSIDALVQTVQYSTCKEDGTPGYEDYSFATRKDKKNLLELVMTGRGIRIMNQTVSFMNTMLITLAGPFITVVLNLMFKHIHIEPPLRG